MFICKKKNLILFLLMLFVCINNCFVYADSNVIKNDSSNQYSKKNPKKIANFYNIEYDENLLQTLRTYNMQIIEVGENCTIKRISDAVSVAYDDTIIFIHKGFYYETIKAFDKKLHFFGEDRESTVIVYNSNDYFNPPFEISKGSMHNLTIDSQKNELINKKYYATAYNIHIDDMNSVNEELLIRNCSLKNDLNASLGIGLHEGQRLYISDCYINGSIYLHNEYYFFFVPLSDNNKQYCKISNSIVEGNMVIQLFDRPAQNVDINITNVEVKKGIMFIDEYRNQIEEINGLNWPQGVQVSIISQ